MRSAVFALAIGLATPALAQTPPAIDNDRVAVWDVQLHKGVAGPPTPHDLDAVIVFLEGGKVETTRPGGARNVRDFKFGDAVFVPKGSDTRHTLLSDKPAHEIVVALKDAPSVRYQNTTGLPAAFPRPGATQVLDNARVTVWNHTWTPNVPSLEHFHEKDVVVAYRFDGALKSVAPDGVSVSNTYKAGEIRFNRGDRAHYEVSAELESAIMVELK
jgi:hypothetical protein